MQLRAATPVGGLTWLDDEHYSADQRQPAVPSPRQDRPVDAVRRSRLCCEIARHAAGSAAGPSGPAGPRSGGGATAWTRSAPAPSSSIEDDLYFANFDGTPAVRLTRSPGGKELISFSPDGKHVAFVRGGNLFAVDLATQTEKALTTDGGGVVFNGKGDWVYSEEIFNRGGRAYWWSPDSKSIAFLRFDDAPVKKFTIVDHLPTRLDVETQPYPKAGDPNPLASLHVVPVGGGTSRDN